MVEIRLRNSKTRRTEVLNPITPGKVSMYLCGPTVYDRAHIGNARSAVVFDQLFRLLRHVYGAENVNFVRNFTDVDDKINARAAETGREIGEITDETAQWYLDDMGALGVLEPTHMPRATAYIPQMRDMISVLIEKGFAYTAREPSNDPPREYVLADREAMLSEHALFEVQKYARYGELSGRSTDDMIAGARVEVAPYKRNPMDFVLWKPSKKNDPGWDSPWGRGRPGWHIECSAMAKALLGDVFDIHAGGSDLMFPHHENEIAQSCCANGTEEMARIWMHNEMLQVEGKKMSKSLGNFFTVRDLLDQGIPGEVIRFVMLSTHYGKPMDWTERGREEAEKTLRKWRDLLGTGPTAIAREVPEQIIRALADDLNTARAIAELHKLANSGELAKLSAGTRLMGLLEPELGDWYDEPKLPEDIIGYVQQLIDLRLIAKDERDYPQADEIRNGLEYHGFKITDVQGGSDWSYDVLQAARPFHDELVGALVHGTETDFSNLAESLRRDGFGVDIFSAAPNPHQRVLLKVGRTGPQRARLIEELRKRLPELVARYK